MGYALGTTSNIATGGGGTTYGSYTVAASSASYGTQVSGTLTVTGDADFDGNVKIKGKDLMKVLEQIEERLAILQPNLELESRWEELKELSKKYRELEASLLEKEKIIDILKK
jgi:hypothetical protein